jgi:SnoaL-like domain
MDLIERLLIERACERLCVEYARRADARTDDFADVFTEDGELVLPAVTARGRVEILALIRRRREEGLLTRHICSNVLVNVVSPTEATGKVDSIYFLGRPINGVATKRVLAPHAVGEYSDHYRLTEAGWRIAHRSFRIVFVKAEPAITAGIDPPLSI